MERTRVSVCWTYILTHLLDSAADNWPQIPPDFDMPLVQQLLARLLFGATKDPVKEIRLSSIWSSLNEDIVVDSEVNLLSFHIKYPLNIHPLNDAVFQVYTDLDPMQAPLWTVQVELSDSVPSLLTKTLSEFLDLCHSKRTMEELLGGNYTVLQSPDSPEYELALGALTKEGRGSAYSLLSSNPLIKAARKAKAAARDNKSGGPMPEETIVALLNFLFPDAEGEPSVMKTK